jgi:DNA-binding MarR family transcriptional regulator
MDKVKVSRAAAALVGRGLLRQSQDPQDGRGRLLRLTRKGTTVFATIAPTARSIEADLAAGVTRAEWNTLQRTLGKLMNHTQNLLGDSDLDEDT